MDENRCYSLKVSSQRLWGERYCSVNGNPSNMTWYCYKPERDPHHRPNLVYGSAYVGEHPDDWEKNCRKLFSHIYVEFHLIKTNLKSFGHH